jgi:NitT/TauT family transport system ATP-binding protein
LCEKKQNFAVYLSSDEKIELPLVGRLMPEKNIIIAQNLSKSYWTRKKEWVSALENINFTVGETSFISIIGPSGCGKSTLLKIIAGLIPSSSGDCHIDGRAVRAPSQDVGFVFQNAVLLPWFTVLENVLLPIKIQKRQERDSYVDQAHKLIEMVGLKGFENSYPFELSGGMQQRTAIIRALIYDPKVLLMDEPFGALDAMTRDQMNIELMRIWAGSRKTILFVTHSIQEATLLSDRVIVMSARPGKIIEDLVIDLPRPRTTHSTATERFDQLTSQLRNLLGMRSF